MTSSRIISGLIISLTVFIGLTSLGGAASAQQYITSTVAGTVATPGYLGDGSAAFGAEISNPLCIALDSKGNYYIADSKNFVVRMVSASTGVISTVAGTGTEGYSGDGGPATSAALSTVEGLAVDSSGNLYISDTGNARIRVVNAATGIISTYAGTGARGDTGDHGPALSAEIFMPAGLAIDFAGNLYIADYGNGTVRKVTSTGMITTAAGVDFIGFAVFPGDDGPAGQATLGLPYSVAVDESGVLYIGDLGSSSIRKVGTNGHISTLVPQVATAGLAVDPSGNLYYGDYRASTIVKTYPNGFQATIAGNYVSGYATDGAPGIASEFNHPYSVALDSSSNIYVADYSNNAIRLLTLLPPADIIIASGASNVAYTAGAKNISNVPIAVAPGEIVTLFGASIGPGTAAQATPDANGLIEKQLTGTTVTFNGLAAPVLSTSSTEVVAIVPYELSGATSATVQVLYQNSVLAAGTVPVAATAPQVFNPASIGFTAGTVLNVDGSVNGPGNPAAESSTITIFVTGEGQTLPHGVDGLVAEGPTFPLPAVPVSVTIGGSTAALSTYGGVLGQPAGVMQIIATIPSSVTTSSTVPVVVTVGGASSLPVNIAVQ